MRSMPSTAWTASINCTKGDFPSTRGKLVPPVKIDDLPQQRHFAHAPRRQSPHLVDDLRDRPAPLRPARRGHDAKSAMHVAPLHDRDKRRDLPRRQTCDRESSPATPPPRQYRRWKTADHPSSPPRCARGKDLVHVIGHPVKFLRADDEIDMADAAHQFRARGSAPCNPGTRKPSAAALRAVGPACPFCRSPFAPPCRARSRYSATPRRHRARSSVIS